MLKSEKTDFKLLFKKANGIKFLKNKIEKVKGKGMKLKNPDLPSLNL